MPVVVISIVSTTSTLALRRLLRSTCVSPRYLGSPKGPPFISNLTRRPSHEVFRRGGITRKPSKQKFLWSGGKLSI